MCIQLCSYFSPLSTQRGAILIAVLPHSAPFYVLPRLSKEQQHPDSCIASTSVKITQEPSAFVLHLPLATVDFLPFFHCLQRWTPLPGPVTTGVTSTGCEEVALAVSLLFCSRWLPAADSPSLWALISSQRCHHVVAKHQTKSTNLHSVFNARDTISGKICT